MTNNRPATQTSHLKGLFPLFALHVDLFSFYLFNLFNQAAALAACQFLANEASRPAEPPISVAPEAGPEQEKPPPQSSTRKIAKSKHLQKKKARTRKPTPPPPPPLVQQLVEMGFSRSRAEYALKELADEEEPRAELVVAWLIDHPDIEVEDNVVIVVVVVVFVIYLFI